VNLSEGEGDVLAVEDHKMKKKQNGTKRISHN